VLQGKDPDTVEHALCGLIILNITVTKLKTLITKNQTLVLSDSFEFVASGFQVPRTVVQDAICIHKSGTGIYASVYNSVFDNNLVSWKVHKILDVRE
jgi:hypothetical protein